MILRTPSRDTQNAAVSMVEVVDVVVGRPMFLCIGLLQTLSFLE